MAVSIALSLSMAACGGSPQTSSGSSEVHFYSINGLTGQSAFYGKGSAEFVKLLANKVNSQGGFTDSCGGKHMVKITYFDDADTPAQAIAGVQQAASDPSVLGFFGGPSDVAWLPEVPVAGQRKIPMIIASDGSDIPADKWNKYAFRIYGSANATQQAAEKILKKAISFNRVAILYDITQDAQRTRAELWKSDSSTLGFTVVAYQSFSKGDTNFRPQLTAIKAANPDLLVFLAAEPSALYNQAKELGITAAEVEQEGNSARADEWDLTHGAVLNSYYFAPNALGEGIQYHDPSAVSLYQQDLGTLPIGALSSGWDALNIGIEAVKKTCSTTDREKYRNYLASVTNFPLVLQGSVTWKNPPTGENLTPAAVVAQVTGKAQIKIIATTSG